MTDPTMARRDKGASEHAHDEDLKALQIANAKLDVMLMEQRIRLAPLRLFVMIMAVMAVVGWVAVVVVWLFGIGPNPPA